MAEDLSAHSNMQPDPASILPTQMNPTTLSALEELPQQLEAHYAAIPIGFKHWAPASWEGVPSEPFTAIE